MDGWRNSTNPFGSGFMDNRNLSNIKQINTGRMYCRQCRYVIGWIVITIKISCRLLLPKPISGKFEL